MYPQITNKSDQSFSENGDKEISSGSDSAPAQIQLRFFEHRSGGSVREMFI